MNKQLEKIQKITVKSEEELNNLLNEDSSNCCPRKKRKSILKTPVAAPVKRPSTNGFTSAAQPPAKKLAISVPHQKIKIPTNTYKPAPTSAKPGPASRTTNNNEIVCTPDILGLFNDNDDNAIPTTNMMPSTSIAPPPLVMRNKQQQQQRILPQTTPILTAPAPIYHNVNGYQIDLNHAARQEIFRLPNGKLIQVRKQTNTPSPGLAARPGTAPRGPQFTIRQAGPVQATSVTTTTRMFRPQAPQQRNFRPNAQPQQRFTFSDGRVLSNSSIPPAQLPPPVIPAVAASTVFTQQNGSISVARAPQPDTLFGKAKTEFEDKIISGMEICQHTINKMITLTNSSSFKTSRTFSDLKDLYIHLQYLFTYTSGKMKTLQENLTAGQESLAKHDSALKEKDDADELEIVEEKQDVIEVLSDDDEAIEKEKERAREANTIVAAAAIKKPILKHIQYTGEDKPSSPAAVATVEKEPESPTETTGEEAPMTQIPGEGEVSVDPVIDIGSIISSDKKLQNKIVVKVEKLEDSKNPIIKHYIKQIQERVETEEAVSSREPTPVNTVPEVVLDESEKDEESVAVKSTEESENVAAISGAGEHNEKADNVEKSSEIIANSSALETAESSGEETESAAEATIDTIELEKSTEVTEINDSETAEIQDAVAEPSKKLDILKIDNAPPEELMEIDAPEELMETDAPEESEKKEEEEKKPEDMREYHAEDVITTLEEPETITEVSPELPNNEQTSEKPEDVVDISHECTTSDEVVSLEDSIQNGLNDSSVMEVSLSESEAIDGSIMQDSTRDEKPEELAENGIVKSPAVDETLQNGFADATIDQSVLSVDESLLADIKTVEETINSSDDLTKITDSDFIDSFINNLGEEPGLEINDTL